MLGGSKDSVDTAVPQSYAAQIESLNGAIKGIEQRMDVESEAGEDAVLLLLMSITGLDSYSAMALSAEIDDIAASRESCHGPAGGRIDGSPAARHMAAHACGAAGPDVFSKLRPVPPWFFHGCLQGRPRRAGLHSAPLAAAHLQQARQQQQRQEQQQRRPEQEQPRRDRDGEGRPYYLVGWDRAAALAGVLWSRAAEAAGGQEFSCIATASRGGLVPARLVADASGIGRIVVDAPRVPAGALFVDDICDTGATLSAAAGRAEDPGSLVCAALFARRGRGGRPARLVFAEETGGDEYVVFPWEFAEHSRRVLRGAPGRR